MEAALRSSRERWLQTICFEGLGLALIAPACSALAVLTLDESVLLLASLSLAAMAWAAGFNTVFDRIELRWTGRAASDRPHRLRVLHALLYEATAVLATCPLIVALTGAEWLDALCADLALSLVYAAYGYLFHWSYDRLRPCGVAGSAMCGASAPRAAGRLTVRAAAPAPRGMLAG